MRLVEYSPAYFEAVHRAFERLEEQFGLSYNLCHRPFVDYYYGTRDWCKLYLFLNEDDSVGATLGIEQMPFALGPRKMTLGFGTNYYAFQPGAGGYLFMQWLKLSPIGMVFEASEDVLRILASQKWTFFPGIKLLILNRRLVIYPGDKWLRRMAKGALRWWPRPRLARFTARLEREVRSGVSIREEREFAEDLLPRTSPFAFRFAPSVEYLGWRYNLSLSFVRYRLYRIMEGTATRGYVILSDLPDKLIVAQCDGENPVTLTSGVLLSILDASRHDPTPREVVLTSSHPQMQQVYRRAGFRVSKRDKPFVLGSRRQRIDLPADTSKWLINFDWGDNGLLAPFLDQCPDKVVVHS